MNWMHTHCLCSKGSCSASTCQTQIDSIIWVIGTRQFELSIFPVNMDINRIMVCPTIEFLGGFDVIVIENMLKFKFF